MPEDRFAGEPYSRQALPSGVTPETFTVKVGDRWVASLTTKEWMCIMMRGGVPAFIAAATFVGACWGWVAWRTGSIRWATLFHVLTDFLGLGATIYLLS